MKLKPEQLQSHFKSQQPFPIYWVSGDEVLLRNECLDHLRFHLRQHGFEEREKFTIDTQFDWSNLFSTLHMPSLFGEKKRVEIDLTFTSVKKQVTDPLLDIFAAAEKLKTHQASLVIIYSNKLDAKQLQSSWYKQLTAAGCHIPIWPVPKEQLINWISARSQAAGLEADRATCQALAHQVEGNLLAAQQEIEKLALLYGKQRISVEHIKQASSDQSQFSIFDFSDMLLSTESSQVLRCLDRLEQSGAETILILWALAREIRLLIEGQEILQQRKSLTQWMKSKRVHPKRQPLLVKALKRTSYTGLLDALAFCQRTDASIKGLSPLTPWHNLRLIATSICSGDFSLLTQALHQEAQAIV